jgi:ribosomal protein S18 acetylase RimI-like enzyme
VTSPADLTIRPATAADMNAVGRLAAMLVRDFHAFDSQRFLAPTPDTAEGYGDFLGSQIGKRDTHVLVAERASTVVGYAYCGIEGYDWMMLRGPAGVLHDIVVDPEHRRAGVGVALLNAALAWLEEREAPRIVLNTANGNVAAQRFFEKAGFRRTMVEMTRETPR